MEMKALKKAAILLTLLSLATLALPTEALSTKPPEIVLIEIERPTLYRGLQTLRVFVTAVDDITPVHELVVTGIVRFADWQTILMPLIYDPDTMRFLLFLPVPSGAGLGVALVEITVIDEHKLSTKKAVTVTILDHTPVLEERFSTLLSIASAELIIGSWGGGINMTGAAKTLESAKEKFKLAEIFLFSLEDVDLALTAYKDAKSLADEALTTIRANVDSFYLALRMREEALVEIVRASSLIQAWEAFGVDVKKAKELFADAEKEYALGLKLLTYEGAEGAASAFARAKVLASYATDYTIKAAEAHLIFIKAKEDIEKDLRAKYELAVIRLADVSGKASALRAYILSLRGLGVDVIKAETLSRYVDDAMKALIKEFELEKGVELLKTLDFIEKQIAKAYEEADVAAKERAEKLLADARGKVKAILGALFAPDVSKAETMILEAEDAIEEKDYVRALSWLAQASSELEALSASQGAAFSAFSWGVTAIVVVALLSGVAIKLRRRE